MHDGRLAKIDLSEKHIRNFMLSLGLDLNNENFKETPQRVTRFYQELIHRDTPAIKVFPSTSNEMVVLKDFKAYSLCPHHLLPVKYTFRVGYIPKGHVIGLSKIPRVVDWLMSSLPLQEDIPDLVVGYLEDVLQPLGAGCQVRGQHMCMEMRGIRREGEFIATKLTGMMLVNPATHEEFLTC